MDQSGLSLGLAFAAGFLSFASPCVLPLIPSWLSLVTGGASSGGKVQSFTRTLAFVLGFGIVFIVLGLVFSGGGLAVGPALPWIRLISGALVILLAANIVLDFIPFLNYEKRAHITKKPQNFLGSMIIGMAFGAGWTPCIGPILSGILFMAGSSSNLLLALLYLAVYTIGLGLPFLILSLGIERFKPGLDWMKRHMKVIKWASALVLAAMGVMIALGQFTLIIQLSSQASLFLSDWIESAPQTVAIVEIIILSILSILAIWRATRAVLNHLKIRSIFLIGVSVILIVLLVLDITKVISIISLLAIWLSFQGI